ncbi:carbonic anhydrase 2-like [Condylostylus longicornis]|uniref:carbonic anhydrase 2-like n=1 Tax=Condylostylus longicornis TaxID=2530218 RepID=UPI00244E53C7|nr:carbonic anhydrase 2-like [Condylostylus longicornis]
MKKMNYINNLIVILIVLLTEISNSIGDHRFGYNRPDQRRWSKKHNHCAGKMQSPIALSTSRAIPIPMPAIEFVGYHNLLPAPLKLVNNGHTVILHIPRLTDTEIEMGEFLPFIYGGKLEGHYEIESLHFHWGDKNNRGAEHLINDIRYAMEMHIVHRNKKYASLGEALEYSDGVAVLGFFYALDENEGEQLHQIVKNLNKIPNPEDFTLLNSTFALSSLFANIDDNRFYTYRGSLTTPPCSEAVTWVLFPDPIPISTSQISKFRHLHSSLEGSVLVDNFRSVQPIGNRRIFLRKINIKNTPNTLIDNDIHYSKWDWLY